MQTELARNANLMIDQLRKENRDLKCLCCILFAAIALLLFL